MRGRLVSAGVGLGAAAALAVLVSQRAGRVGDALGAVSWHILALVAVLHALSLVCRSESWIMSMAATRDRPMPRRAVHGANGIAFVAGAVQGQLSMPIRVAMLRRALPETAPRPAQIAVADVPICLLEIVGSGLVLAGAAVLGATALWTAAVVIAAGAGGLLALRWLARRFAHRPIAAGLAVLGDRRRGPLLAGLIGAITGLAVIRTALLLSATGMPHGPDDVAMLLCAAGAIGLLPIGAGAPPAAAAATVGAAGGLTGALAVGLAISATQFAGVLLYGSVVLTCNAAAAARRRRADRAPLTLIPQWGRAAA